MFYFASLRIVLLKLSYQNKHIHCDYSAQRIYIAQSILRRKLVMYTNILLLSDNRWSAKYKSVRIFEENFINIKSVLEKLSHNNDSKYKINTTTQTKAHQLSCATST